MEMLYEPFSSPFARHYPRERQMLPLMGTSTTTQALLRWWSVLAEPEPWPFRTLQSAVGLEVVRGLLFGRFFFTTCPTQIVSAPLSLHTPFSPSIFRS